MNRVWVALIIGVLFYSSSSLLIKATSTPPVTLAFYRVFLATVVSTPLWGKEFLKWWRLNFSLPIIVASLALTMDFVLWFFSIRFTSVAHATFLVNMAPLWVGLLSLFFLKEPLSVFQWLAISLGVLGAAIMSLHIPLGGVNIGDIMALGASGCLAVYLIMTRMGNRGMSNSVFTYSLFLFTSAWLFLMVILFGQGFSLSSHDLPYAIAMALGPQLGGNSLVNFSLRYLPPSVVSVALLGEPIIATLASFILFGEVISWQTVVGGLFICLGLYAVLKENGTQGA